MPPPSGDVEPLPVGKWWDAVRVTSPAGERALGLLGTDTGAVIQDSYGTLYWLVAIGSAASRHLRGTRVLCELIDEVTYLGVPPVDWTEPTRRGRTHWRVPLGPGRYLTDTQRLWEALAAADHAELGPRVEGRQLCVRCQLPTDEPVLVGAEGGSIGGAVYACPPARPGVPAGCGGTDGRAAPRRRWSRGMTAVQQEAQPVADPEWRAAIEHAAGCLMCRTPGAPCERGETLLAAYAEAMQLARSGGDR